MESDLEREVLEFTWPPSIYIAKSIGYAVRSLFHLPNS